MVGTSSSTRGAVLSRDHHEAVVLAGLGRIAASHDRSSASYQIH
jgi:hypothetical protein